MSRDDGFTVMDVSVAIHEDGKFKALARRHPELAAASFTAYVAVMGESWAAGKRVPIEDNWPARLIPFDRAVVCALRRFKLLDKTGLIWPETWDRWFGPAAHRQEQSRERWRRANEKRHAAAMASLAVTASEPRGNSADTAATVPSEPSEPSVPTEPSVLQKETTPQPPSRGGRRANGTNARAISAEMTRRNEERERERKARRTFRQRAYLDGRITEAQRADMDDRDAPLTEIPTQRGAAYAQA
jgi:hypothetical protein